MVGAVAPRPGAVRVRDIRCADAQGPAADMKRSRCRDRPQLPPPPPATRREDGAQRAAELPQPLPSRRRAPSGRQLLEERVGPAGPEVREQVALAGVSEGRVGEGEPERERWGRAISGGKTWAGALKGWGLNSSAEGMGGLERQKNGEWRSGWK